MTPGLGHALGAMLFFGLGDFFLKRSAATGSHARHYVMMQAWVFCPAMTLYAWATGNLVLGWGALWGCAAGIASYIAFYNFGRSLQGGAVSTMAPIFRMNFTVAVVLAVLLLGETLSAVKLAALACTFGAVWLLLAEPAATRGKADWKSLSYVLIATLGMGLANFFYKMGLLHGALPETIMTAQAWLFCPLATLLVWLNDRNLSTPAAAWPYAAGTGICLLFGFVILLHGLSIGAASVLVPVAQMGFVFTALAGALLFTETLTMRKRVGLVVAVAALALFAVA
ncbi:MAG TPA: EamA family transporter [Pseudolabrys sp.]|jgi:transporter family protein